MWVVGCSRDCSHRTGAARERIARYHRDSVVPPLGFWAIEVRETGQAVGSVGWHLHPDAWGHGYASEAANAVLAHGLESGLPEVLALTHPDNYPSQGVARRIGMQPLGVMEQWYEGPSMVFRAQREVEPRSGDPRDT